MHICNIKKILDFPQYFKESPQIVTKAIFALTSSIKNEDITYIYFEIKAYSINNSTQ